MISCYASFLYRTYIVIRKIFQTPNTVHSVQIPSTFCLEVYQLLTNTYKESEVAQSCPTLFDPMDCSLPGSSVHGIFQARVLEWIAISFSRGSSQPRVWTRVSHIVDRCFTIWAYWWSPNPPVTINYRLDFLLFPLLKLIPSGSGPSLWLHRGI